MDEEILRQLKSLSDTVEPQDRPAIIEIIRKRAFRIAFHAFQVELDKCLGIHFDEPTLSKLEAVRSIIER